MSVVDKSPSHSQFPAEDAAAESGVIMSDYDSYPKRPSASCKSVMQSKSRPDIGRLTIFPAASLFCPLRDAVMSL